MEDAVAGHRLLSPSHVCQFRIFSHLLLNSNDEESDDDGQAADANALATRASYKKERLKVRSCSHAKLS